MKHKTITKCKGAAVEIRKVLDSVSLPLPHDSDAVRRDKFARIASASRAAAKLAKDCANAIDVDIEEERKAEE